MGKRVRPDKKSWKYATGTTKKAPKEWELLMGIDFIKYVERKARRK